MSAAGAEFVDQHRDILIQRVTPVEPIVDMLLKKNMIHQESYSRVLAATTTQDKMRELYMVLDSGGAAVKDEFYTILESDYSLLVRDLGTIQMFGAHNLSVHTKSKNMLYLTTVQIIGGDGGRCFYISGQNNGATLKKIWVWVGGWQVKAIKVWLTDGQFREFGYPSGKFTEFQFEDGERFTSLSLWGNGNGTRLGAIKFKTNHSREFFAYMTELELETEYPVDVGSGICIGIVGNSGADIDSLGFLFLNTIKSTILTNVQYPTLHQVTPQVITEELKSMTYQNRSSVTQEYKIDTSKTITKKSSWSVPNKMEANFHMEVSAGIPEVAEVFDGLNFTLQAESTYGLEYSEQKTEVLSFSVQVPPGKTMDVDITIGRAKVDLPYTGTVQITCFNGSVLEINISGTYKGLTYTKAKTVVSESLKKLE
ncbi:aerolysin-like protein isoform X1 [Lepisosteus oculatus]|nr:PREDICTED: natterin-like protein [Lepisosteus oculatus]